ncbi:toa1 Transcription initiation factor IIA large subunit [Candida maltosa Xu316]
MSNIETSKLYESVIEDVINDSRQDFENSGIDESTLQELKKLWQEKLTIAGVSNFSWEKEDEEEEEQELEVPGIHDPVIKQDSENGSANAATIPTTSTASIKTEPGVAGVEDEAEEEDDVLGIQIPKINQTDEIHTPKKLLRKINKKLVQIDGAFDEDDEDSDLDDINDFDSDINSDLDDDDPEDQDNDEEGQVALCLYDKVQRIKSKWKCSLKEGIANINGKDYVFNKATGECEW